MKNRTLEDLFARYRDADDVAALGEAFDLAAPELLKVARHVAGDDALAEDAVQATFQTAIEKRHAWDGARPLLPWMLGVLNLHVKQARERAERAFEEDRLVERRVADPAQLAEDSELSEIVSERVASLPETYRTALQSHLFDGKPAREIGRALGITANAASVRLHRGLKLLQRGLPAGVSLGAFGVFSPTRGIDVLRADVLRAATRSAGKGALPTAAALSSKSFVPAAVGAAVVAGLIYVSPLDLEWRSSAREPIAVPSGSATRPEERTELATPVSLATPAPTAAPTNARVAEPTAGASVAETDAISRDPQVWLARFEQSSGWREHWSIAAEIAKLPADEALALMRAIFHDIPGEGNARKQVLKPFVFDDFEHELEMIHLAITDHDLEVQSAGFLYLNNLTFRDFSADFGAYEAWWNEYGGRPLPDVVEANLVDFVARLRAMSPAELAKEVERIRYLRLDRKEVGDLDPRTVLRDEGLLQLIEGWLQGTDETLAANGLYWAGEIGASEDWLRLHVVPLLHWQPGERDPRVSRAADALGQPGNTWAIPILLDAFLSLPAHERKSDASYMGALADIGDASIIPALIGILVADGDTHYSVGYFGLGRLTGVEYDESHQGEFWLKWWNDNQARLPESIRGAPIPVYSFGD